MINFNLSALLFPFAFMLYVMPQELPHTLTSYDKPVDVVLLRLQGACKMKQVFL